MKALELKKLILTEMKAQLELKISSTQSDIASIQDSKLSATKSTAGDKHETGRAMMERELVMAQAQLSKSQRMLADIDQIESMPATEKVGFSSLVVTSSGKFLIGAAFGKVEVSGETCFAISGVSPMGEILLGKKVGEEYEFRGLKNTVESIS